MSIALVGPLNRIAGVMEKGMLESYALVTARERVRNFVLSLQGPGDAPILEDYLQDSTNRAGWNAVLGEASDINAIAELALPFGAVVNSPTAMDTLVSHIPTLTMLLNRPEISYSLINTQVSVTSIFNNQSAVETIFNSVDLKRLVFDSVNAELAIRSSSVAMNYAHSIATEVSESLRLDLQVGPAPISNNGKWFIVQCVNLYTVGTYTRNISTYRHGQQSLSGTWANYSYSETGMQAPFNEPVALSNANAVYESLHGRFFNSLRVRARASFSSNSTQRYLYINMDAEGSA